MAKTVRLKDPMNLGSAPSNIMVIGQSSYGLISPKVNAELGVDKLETYYLSLCVGLALTDRNTNTGLLAHLDVDAELKLKSILNKLTIREFSKATIVCGELANTEVLREVRKFSTEHAKEVDEIFIWRNSVYQSPSVARIGVGLDLETYLPSDAYRPTYMNNCGYRLKDRRWRNRFCCFSLHK